MIRTQYFVTIANLRLVKLLSFYCGENMAFWSDIAFFGSNIEFLSHMALVGQL